MPSFDALLDSVRRPSVTVTVYAPSDANADAIAATFDSLSVTVDVRPLPSTAPGAFVAFKTDGRVVGVLPTSTLTHLLAPPVSRPADPDAVSRVYRVVFDLLDEIVFTTADTQALQAVSEEIEDRAYRAGAGVLHVSFQSLSAFEPQVDRYRALAADTTVDIHVYGAPDWTPPSIPGITYHTLDPPRTDYWVLTFTATDPDRAVGLLAERRETGFHGCWTDDPDRVADITAALAEPND